MRIRLRPAYSLDELQRIYAEPTNYKDPLTQIDHHVRIDVTITLARRFWRGGQVADLSAGDGGIPLALRPDAILGDFAPGWDYVGPIQETIEQIPNVEMFICSETIEHLDDPDPLFGQIRRKAETLILSTPLGETTTGIVQHYWGWDDKEIERLLTEAGWHPQAYVTLACANTETVYQIWVAT